MPDIDKSRYSQRGVSASKSEVHEAIKDLDKGLFPNAFCKLLPDLAGGSEDYVNVMHADTAGTKTSLAYLYWRETGDLSVWEGVVQDSIVMNVDDMACVGCIDNIILSSTVGRNKSVIPAEVIKAVIGASGKFIDSLKPYGISLTLAGGETADVGDIVRTIDVGITAFGRMKKDEVVSVNVRAGDVIVGFASDGQATYEDHYNGGMGSNGLTSARHDVLSKVYKSKYPESFDNAIPDELVYSGSKLLTEPIILPNGYKTDVGRLILSPTRTYLPLLKRILANFRNQIHGLIHCTGGAQTKIMKFVENKRIIKDALFPVPYLFSMIEEESGTPRKEMYQVFNMGHRLECYTDETTAQELIALSKEYNINAKIIGRVEASKRNELIISDESGVYTY